MCPPLIAMAGFTRKGRGKPAQLCDRGHVLMESRQGLAAPAQLTCATGMAEREGALEMIRKRKVKRAAAPGADKGYNASTFKRDLEQAGFRAPIAMNSGTGRGGLPTRPRRACYPRDPQSAHLRKPLNWLRKGKKPLAHAKRL